MNTRLFSFLLILMAFLCGDAPPNAHAQLRPPNREGRAQRETIVSKVFESCRDSVVTFSSEKLKGEREGLNEFVRLEKRNGEKVETTTGSGFIIHRGGYIATNAHVVTRSSTREVILSDDRKFVFRVIAIDRGNDMAVVKIDNAGTLKPVTLALPNDVFVGERLILIGHPHGLIQTCTTGVVSALNRGVNTEYTKTLKDMIQTDVAINPGSSGGPLFNVLGEVVGVATSRKNESDNISFAGSVATLRRLLPGFLDVERRARIVTGLRLKESDGGDSGCGIVSVAKDSPAAKAGLRAGDVIERANGRVIDTLADWSLALIGISAGDVITVTYSRDSKANTVKLKPTAGPVRDSAKVVYDTLGVRLKPLASDGVKQMKLRFNIAMVVNSIDSDRYKDAKVPRPGDVLVRIGMYRPLNAEHAASLIARYGSGSEYKVVFLRSSGKRLSRFDVGFKVN